MAPKKAFQGLETERDKAMNQVLRWNDAVYEICNVSTIRGDQGTVWRYDISGNQSLVVVPFEAKPFTMDEATAAPEYIFPTLAGLRGEGNMLGFLFREIVLGDEVGSDALKHIRQFIERFGMKKPTEKKVVKPRICWNRGRKQIVKLKLKNLEKIMKKH